MFRNAFQVKRLLKQKETINATARSMQNRIFSKILTLRGIGD